MISVGVNPPKTPVTEGSSDIAAATLPNVCKMPGPPAPFVPTPFPNIGRSGDNLSEATKTLEIQGKKVAIKGSYYMSKGSPDLASKSSGGGVVSSTEEGKTKFAAPGSMNVKAEGKNIQLLGDAMTNNGSNPSNSGTIPGNVQIAAAALGVSEKDATAICQAFCQAEKEHLNPKNKKVKGSGSASARFEQLLKKKNIPGLRTEQSYWMPRPPAAPQLLTRSVFNSLARSLSNSRTFNLVKGLIGAAGGASGQSVLAGAGVRLSRAMRLAGQAGRVCRPDVVLSRGGKDLIMDAKFRFFSGGKDKFTKRQLRNYRRLGKGKKPKEINGGPDCCGCPHNK